jgi:uncharacterized protein YoxC
MDILQIALVLLILVLAILLSVLGIQVFFILKDLRRSMDRMDRMLADIEKPVHLVGEVADVVDAGAKLAQSLASTMSEKKPKKRIFKLGKK